MFIAQSPQLLCRTVCLLYSSPKCCDIQSLLNCFFFIEGAAPLTSDELSSLSPTAAATSSFLKSGMTLTQVKVYS